MQNSDYILSCMGTDCTYCCPPPLTPDFDIISRFSNRFAKEIYLPPNLCRHFWSFLMLKDTFFTTCWLVVKQSQQAPTIRYLLLWSSNTKNKWNSEYVFIRRWQWTKKYKNEQINSICWEGGLLCHRPTWVRLLMEKKFITYSEE